mgnify:CR=1 FL=1
MRMTTWKENEEKDDSIFIKVVTHIRGDICVMEPKPTHKMFIGLSLRK